MVNLITYLEFRVPFLLQDSLMHEDRFRASSFLRIDINVKRYHFGSKNENCFGFGAILFLF